MAYTSRVGEQIIFEPSVLGTLKNITCISEAFFSKVLFILFEEINGKESWHSGRQEFVMSSVVLQAPFQLTFKSLTIFPYYDQPMSQSVGIWKSKSKFSVNGIQGRMFNLVSGWALVVMETHLCHPMLLLGRSSQVIP